jgi:hypothetical protein
MPGILTHSYALTSHAAQGATYETGRILTVEGGNPVALYVGASRGRTDLRIYAAGRHPTNDTPDTLRSRGHTPLQELVQSARKTIEHRLAIELDPTLTGVPCPGSPRAGIEHRHVTPNLSLPSPR